MLWLLSYKHLEKDMFPLPLDKTTEACIVGIDPGSETLGVCVLYFNVITLAITRISPTTYTGSKLPTDPMLSIMHNDRVSRVKAHENNLLEIFNNNSPIAVSTESPFYNPRMPGAFGALVEVTCGIRNAVIRYSDVKPLYKVDPSSVKQAIGAKGNADKDGVRGYIGKIQEIVNNLDRPLSALDEHSIDATAVAYHQLLSYRNSTLSYI